MENNAPAVLQEKPKISEKSATETFDKWLEYYDIKFEHIVNDQGKEGAATLQNKLVEAIRWGKIETQISEDLNEGFQIIQHTTPGKDVVYNEYGYKAAKESLQEVQKVAPNFLPSQMLIGTVSYLLGELQQAEYHLDKYVKFSPENVKARLLLASIYLKLKQQKRYYLH